MRSQRAARFQVQVLGPVALQRTDSPDAPTLLTQPRHLAVLSYLLLARPRGLHARDTLVALLWPEMDQARARHALRNCLHSLRHALGTDVLGAGEGYVGVNLELIECDALALEADLADGQWAAALDRDQGELLQGFHVTEAPEFERWLDEERRRLLDGVRAATGAVLAARRAHLLDRDDEPTLRLLMRVSAHSGTRSAAIKAYESFAARMRRELGAEPSVESQALADAIRHAPAAVALLAIMAVASWAKSGHAGRRPTRAVADTALLAAGDSALGAALAPPLTPAVRDAGLRRVWRARLARYLAARQDSFVSARGTAIQYAELGDADSTLVWLDSMYLERSYGLRSVLVDRLFRFSPRRSAVSPAGGPGSGPLRQDPDVRREPGGAILMARPTRCRSPRSHERCQSPACHRPAMKE